MIPTLQLGQLGRSSPVASGGVSGLPALILAQSPVAYWRHAEASGTVMVDGSGNARDGAYFGSPIPQSAIYTGGPTCMVSTSSAQFGWYTPALPSLTALTLVTICKPNSVAGIHALPSRDNNSGDRCFQWRMNGTSMEWVKIRGGVSTSTRTGVFAASTACMAAVTVSSSGTVTMYKNGVQLGAAFSIATADYGGAGDALTVGYSSGAAASMNGYNSETALFATDLSAATLLSFATAAGF